MVTPAMKPSSSVVDRLMGGDSLWVVGGPSW